MIIYFILNPELKHCNIRNLGMPKTSYPRVSLSERVKVPKFIKGKNDEIFKIYGKKIICRSEEEKEKLIMVFILLFTATVVT